MAMPLPSGYVRSLEEAWEAPLEEFERAWHERRPGTPPPRWQDFLPPADQPCPVAFVFWLLATDVERRTRAGLPALLAEPYFDDVRLRQAGVTADSPTAADLVRWEYWIRWQCGHRAHLADYVQRFPALAATLADLVPQLRCPRCRQGGVPLAAEDAAAFDCPRCGAHVPVSEASAGSARDAPSLPEPTHPPNPEVSAGTDTFIEPELQGPVAEAAAAAPAPPAWQVGRFAIREQMARGGMGAILRGHDGDLRREVAVKVLLDEHADKPELLRRFVEEAQIGGQLQHPGVVPVYEMGRLGEGQPFFAMKLVKGQTLAELLARRTSPADDRPHFLAIFEQVCQAMAYAHSKRVLHRDLKPTNVMVGAFGEVLVMDWGLAKVLTEQAPAAERPVPTPGVSVVRTTRSDPMAGTDDGRTAAGSVLGTPAYMSPEQAAGQIDALDERSDVFSLGAMLCEILTGKPPYGAVESWRVLYMAGLGEQAEARARLDGCGADAELVALTKECLSPAKADRPRDAAEVARRVADYQRGVQERLHSAERQRAAAEARAEEARATARAEQAKAAADRRARRRAVALVVAVLVLVGVLAVGGIINWHGYNLVQAQALRDRLLGARIANVLPIVEDLGHYRRWAEPLLRQAHAKAEAAGNDPDRLRASLALLRLGWDDGQAENVYQGLLDAEPGDVATLVEVLRLHKGVFTERLWKQLHRPAKEHEGRRLRVACALADYDADVRDWDAVAEPLVAALVAENPVYLTHWRKGLWPVRQRLRPALEAVFRDRAEARLAERELASYLLADWAADQPDVLAALLLDADARQFALLWLPFKAQGPASLEPLEKELRDKARSDADAERLAKRKANAAVALLRLGREDAWPLLRHSTDPRLRSYLLQRLSPLGADVRAVVARLAERDVEISEKRALLLALGEFSTEQFPLAERQSRQQWLLDLYHYDPDPGMHAAAEWLLRTWAQPDQMTNLANKLEKIDAKLWERDREVDQGGQVLAGGRRWYRNGQGQTMVVIDARQPFLMGSPSTEAERLGGPKDNTERRHLVHIGRWFAISSKEVTVEQFRRFRKDHEWNKKFSEKEKQPINQVSWYDAAAYCNWLSEQENIPKDQWCYETNPEDKSGEVVRMKPRWLGLRGYRLPTEAEWEYACRAGALTARYYGETDELLGRYAWYSSVSRDQWMRPPGSVRPNDLGLFDMLGNAIEWCHNKDIPPGKERPEWDKEDEDDVKSVRTKDHRVIRGGSFQSTPWNVRSATRNALAPDNRVPRGGFRPARTYP
jgi:formylglycine-generating enzyme required for sulfatase activity